MKKILALILVNVLALCGTGAMTASATTVDNAAPQPVAEITAEQPSLYLVPGTYTLDGQKVSNTVSGSGVKQLTAAECEDIFTENAYLCTAQKGASLPIPSSTRKDKNGNAYSFNGWWTIVDATVTYFDKVPQISETTYLYADWRADLSQRMDPIIPD